MKYPDQMLNVGIVGIVAGLRYRIYIPHDPPMSSPIVIYCQVTNHEDRAVLRAFFDEHSASPRKDFRSKGQPPPMQNWTGLDWVCRQLGIPSGKLT